MVLSLQEISDRFEIQDLLVAYCHAIDTRDWDALDDVFTDDAVIDYTEMGGTRGGLAATKAFLAEALAGFTSYQHLAATSAVDIDGDTARGRTICHNPMILGPPPGTDGPTRILFAGLWYRDVFVRTPAGWRIRERHEEKSYLELLPSGDSPVST
jgi:ketosteroid isomerase-like protein